MTNLYEMFETSDRLETEGIWAQVGDARFLLARAGGANSKFTKMVEAKMRPHRRQAQAGTLDQGTRERIAMEAFVDSVLLGWENVTGKDGKPIEFSRDAARALFTDLRDLHELLVQESMEYANYRQALLEDDAGN